MAMENAEKDLKENRFNKEFGSFSTKLWLETKDALRTGKPVYLVSEDHRNGGKFILGEEIRSWGLTMEDAISKRDVEVEGYNNEIL